MQRFKKFAMAKGNIRVDGQPRVFGAPYGFQLAHPAANARNGKFVLGAQGTMTQAARWRAYAVVGIDKLRTPSRGVAYADGVSADIRAIRSLLDSAKRGGCRLP